MEIFFIASAALLVSIPFIAGQWSLRLRRSGQSGLRTSFNPLHCGAVVASGSYGPIWWQSQAKVSIPFIAGQWSLPRSLPSEEAATPALFQSPSLRGSGRFVLLRAAQASTRGMFQSPSLRGSGRFAEKLRKELAATSFQSPSLRGSGRFMAALLVAAALAVWFQSPSLRGSGRFAHARRGDHEGAARVSIPFIAGQWSLRRRRMGDAGGGNPFQSPSLRGSGRFTSRSARTSPRSSSFNPLHCGAVVASRGRAATPRGDARSFNPLHCGAVVASGWARRKRNGPVRFNPLHCGAVVASWGELRRAATEGRVLIPFIAGQWSLPAMGSWRSWNSRRS